MKIMGFKKTSFLDYPDKLASIIFTGNCNFRCSYCHNGSLVCPDMLRDESIDQSHVLEYLENKKNIVEALVISGGEPTLCPGLIDFMRRVKKIGLLIKLDTNGYRPQVLRKVVEENLVDYIAMDLKNSFEKYPSTVGISNLDLKKIEESINIIRNSKVEYEFRTTMMKEYHTGKDLEAIKNILKREDTLVLQQYRKVEHQLSDKVFSFYTKDEMNFFRDDIFSKDNYNNIKIRAYI